MVDAYSVAGFSATSRGIFATIYVGSAHRFGPPEGNGASGV